MTCQDVAGGEKLQTLPRRDEGGGIKSKFGEAVVYFGKTEE